MYFFYLKEEKVRRKDIINKIAGYINKAHNAYTKNNPCRENIMTSESLSPLQHNCSIGVQCSDPQKTSNPGFITTVGFSLENIGYLLVVLGGLLATIGFLVPVCPLAYFGLAISFLGLFLCFVVLIVTLISFCISKNS